ncbi:hypothetical protein [Anoxybacteroides rupiense]|uniref:hypothetical protein n=1 Tax=Anoxybacteroides rupiense TaxID=311460 RepID=UPI003FA57248
MNACIGSHIISMGKKQRSSIDFGGSEHDQPCLRRKGDNGSIREAPCMIGHEMSGGVPSFLLFYGQGGHQDGFA